MSILCKRYRNDLPLQRIDRQTRDERTNERPKFRSSPLSPNVILTMMTSDCCCRHHQQQPYPARCFFQICVEQRTWPIDWTNGTRMIVINVRIHAIARSCVMFIRVWTSDHDDDVGTTRSRIKQIVIGRHSDRSIDRPLTLSSLLLLVSINVDCLF
jgi:hypothetical protein